MFGFLSFLFLWLKTANGHHSQVWKKNNKKYIKIRPSSSKWTVTRTAVCLKATACSSCCGISAAACRRRPWQQLHSYIIFILCSSWNSSLQQLHLSAGFLQPQPGHNIHALQLLEQQLAAAVAAASKRRISPASAWAQCSCSAALGTAACKRRGS